MLHRRNAMDPRWVYHQRSVPAGWMNAEIEIYRRSGDAADYGFDPATGGLTDGHGGFPDPLLIFRGKARAATNKDWRARVRTMRGDMGTDHAVRFQITEREAPPIRAHDVVRVVTATPVNDITSYLFHVRNPMVSSNAWLRNILCDVDVAHPSTLPPPHTGPPLTPDAIPAPTVMTCSQCG
jgi:hypothetical protein